MMFVLKDHKQLYKDGRERDYLIQMEREEQERIANLVKSNNFVHTIQTPLESQKIDKKYGVEFLKYRKGKVRESSQGTYLQSQQVLNCLMAQQKADGSANSS